jgi:hypothetical protein
MTLKTRRSLHHACRVVGEYIATIGIGLLATYLILGIRW